MAASAVVGVSMATAGTQKMRACSTPDKAGNWEVVIGHAATSKAAKTIVTKASGKGLTATAERDGCAKRWEVVVTASSKTAASATMKTAKKDGFKSVTTEKS
ncbi:MAG: hypothetical protein WBB76_01950 [Gaiellaceae bacterium]